MRARSRPRKGNPIETEERRHVNTSEENALRFEIEHQEFVPKGLCKDCNSHKATIVCMDFHTGVTGYICECCSKKEFIEQAKKYAEEIPKLERELAEMRCE